MCDLSDDTNDIVKYYNTIKKNKKLDAVCKIRCLSILKIIS